MKAMSETIQIRNQLGAATLVVALVLLLAITLMTFSGVKVGINEQRMATNEVAYREALETAQGALDFGLAYLEDNKNAMNGWGWTACASSTAIPCGNGFANLYSSGGPLPGNWLSFVPSVSLPGLSNNYNYTLGFVTPSSGGLPAANPVVTIVARAVNNSDPSAGTTLRQTVKGYPITINPPSHTITAKGKVKLKKLSKVWGNPIPTLQSIWTAETGTDAVQLQGKDEHGNDNNDHDSKTCSGNYPTCNEVSTKNNLQSDIKKGDFPSDLFLSTFGIASSDYQSLKNEITIFRNCTPFTSGTPPAGIYWINEDCNLAQSGTTTVGSQAAPYVLIVEREFKLGKKDTFHGIVFLKNNNHSDAGKVNFEEDEVRFKGALLSDVNRNIEIDKEMHVVYDAIVINNARNLAGSFAKAPGGWTDQ